MQWVSSRAMMKALFLQTSPVVPNLFYTVAHLPLPAERRGPPSHTTIEASNLSLHVGTNMSKQNMFL